MILLLGSAGECKRGHDRHEGERQDQRAGKGEDHGEGHGAEELSLGPLKGQDGKVDDGDDQNSKQAGPENLGSSVADDFLLGPGSPLVGQPPHTVLDDDDTRINDQAEVDGAQGSSSWRTSSWRA